MFTLKALINSLGKLNRIRQFVYDFDYYNGTETDNNKCIADENVYQYEFWNQGTTPCDINGMILRPEDRVKLFMYNREKDVQVYKYDFDQILGFLGSLVHTALIIPCVGPGACNIWHTSLVINFFEYEIIGDVTFDCNDSPAVIQGKLIAGLNPEFASAVITVISFDAGGLQISVSNIVLPASLGANPFYFFIFQRFVFPCPSLATVPIPLTIEPILGENKLLVISKLPGNREKSNLGL